MWASRNLNPLAHMASAFFPVWPGLLRRKIKSRTNTSRSLNDCKTRKNNKQKQANRLSIKVFTIVVANHICICAVKCQIIPVAVTLKERSFMPITSYIGHPDLQPYKHLLAVNSTRMYMYFSKFNSKSKTKIPKYVLFPEHFDITFGK